MRRQVLAAMIFGVLLAPLVTVLLTPLTAFADGIRPYNKEAFERSRKAGKAVIVIVHADW